MYMRSMTMEDGDDCSLDAEMVKLDVLWPLEELDIDFGNEAGYYSPQKSVALAHQPTI